MTGVQGTVKTGAGRPPCAQTKRAENRNSQLLFVIRPLAAEGSGQSAKFASQIWRQRAASAKSTTIQPLSRSWGRDASKGFRSMAQP